MTAKSFFIFNMMALVCASSLNGQTVHTYTEEDLRKDQTHQQTTVYSPDSLLQQKAQEALKEIENQQAQDRRQADLREQERLESQRLQQKRVESHVEDQHLEQQRVEQGVVDKQLQERRLEEERVKNAAVRKQIQNRQLEQKRVNDAIIRRQIEDRNRR